MLQTIHLIGLGAALVSCFFWLAAAFVRFRPLSITRLRGPESIPESLRRQSMLNAVAAVFAAIAAGSEAMEFLQLAEG